VECDPVEWPSVTAFGQSPFYNPLTSTGPRSWWGNLMHGKRDASGLLYMRNRYYDPAQGRFTQPDPIGLAGGVNLYGFANGDPVSYSDPYGLCARGPGDTIRISVVVDCGDGTTGVREVNAVQVTDPAQIARFVAGANAARFRGNAAETQLFRDGVAEALNVAQNGKLYSHPSRVGRLKVLTTGGVPSGTSGSITLREDLWANLSRGRYGARVPGGGHGTYLQVCGVIAHEGGHSALNARGTPDPNHIRLNETWDDRTGC
jgi:RHS repeat-associated protein